jgi:hypothetical protein
MSLIHTCELNGANPFDYLTELLRHAAELKQRPSEWMPWDYRETLARLATPAAAQCDESCLAEKDRLRPCLGDIPKWRPNRPFHMQNPTTILEARKRPKMFPAGLYPSWHGLWRKEN